MPNLRYTTDAIIASVLRRLYAPAEQRTITESEIAEICNDELHGYIVPTIREAVADYLNYQHTYDVSGGSDDGYEIPGRAVASTIAYCVGNLDDNFICKIPLAQDGDPDTFILSSNVVEYTPDNLVYFIRNNRIHLRPLSNNLVDSITITYPVRPNDLVLEDSTRQITEINGNIITLASEIPDLDNTTPIDIISSKSPYVFRGTSDSPSFDITPVDVTGTDVELSEIPLGVSVGDFVSFAGESCIPQIPYEVHKALAYRTLARCAEAIGRDAIVPTALNSANEIMSKVLPTLVPRVERQPKHIVGANPWVGIFSDPIGWPYRGW